MHLAKLQAWSAKTNSCAYPFLIDSSSHLKGREPSRL
jgi:hypothetical protein